MLLRALQLVPLSLSLTLPAVLAQEATPRSEAPPADEGAQVEEEAEEEGKAWHGFVEARLSFYHSGDNGDGNPFLDEEETVIEPVIVFDMNVSESVAVHGSFSYDFVSSASIDRLSNFPEQSGASGDNYVGGDVGVRFEPSEALTFDLHASASNEYDYNSLGFGGSAAIELFEENTTLSLSVNAFLDEVDVIRFNGREDEGQESRTSVTANLGWYQVLSPTVHMSVGYTFTNQDGFLETAYNAVVLEGIADPPNPNLDNQARGVEVVEELPDTRLRHALYGEVRKMFPSTGSALSFGSRFYVDSWGIESFSGELQLHQWLLPEVLRVRLRYRFYLQTAADDYEDHFFVAPADRASFVASQDRTQDSDLADFTAHTIGLKGTWTVSEGHQVSLSTDYVLRSDGIDQILLSFAYRLDF